MRRAGVFMASHYIDIDDASCPRCFSPNPERFYVNVVGRPGLKGVEIPP
jgi:hypothetical protein